MIRWILFLLLAYGAAPLDAATVVIVGRENQANDRVWQAVEERLGSDNQLIRVAAYDQIEGRQTGGDKPDLIMTLGSEATRATLSIRADIPMVVGMVLEESDIPKEAGVHGIPLEYPPERRLAYIRRVLPRAKVVGVIFSEENRDYIDKARSAASTRDLELLPIPIQSPSQLEDALERIESRADVLWGVFDSMVLTRQTARPILSFCFRHKLPFMGVSASWVEAGALFALGRDYQDYGYQLATLANSILEGEPLLPEHIMDAPREAVLHINAKTARLLKLRIPETALEDAMIIDP